ncbi:MAG: flagellar motor protein MotA [Hyphomicrobiaceae bacterium]|nr:flagellar motor protein MotA [Hyphomicrobiaceae bacterium]
MARSLDPHKLSNPQVFLWRMLIFLIIAGFVALILYRQIWAAFLANPGLNGLIIGVLVLGILLAVRQVAILFREVRWVNAFRIGDPGLQMQDPPRLLGPMAALFRDRAGRMQITPEIMRSILDSIGMRLDESRDITRYLGGLLVFLGLLGTFWGLTETVGSVSKAINSLSVPQNADTGAMFEDLKTGLAAPLGGMGLAFSSSLFGLAGSLVIGFLDLQASQAQNRFYNELEDWLSAVTDLDLKADEAAGAIGSHDMLRGAIDRLTRVVSESGGQGGRPASTAMANLAEGIHGLVQHMRSEQQMVKTWVENQSEQSRDLKKLIDRLNTLIDTSEKE